MLKATMDLICSFWSNPLKRTEAVQTSSWSISELEDEGASLIYATNCVRSMVISLVVGGNEGI
uniref:Uncharacterized protein n=1 Tax=Arundo donax TaxID=35708 RepID=A0A0A9GFB2_ARUDO